MHEFLKIAARTGVRNNTRGVACRQSFPKVAIVLVMLPLLFGCSGPGQWIHNGFKVGPDYSSPSAAVADRWLEADDPRVKQLPGENPQWWIAFRDPALDYLVAAAAGENLTLKTAGFRIMEVREECGVASGDLFPQQQTMSASYMRAKFSENAYPLNIFSLPTPYFNNWAAGVNAAWELDFWGRFRRAVEAADANLDAQCAGYNNVLVLLQAEVATNYIQLRSYQQRLQLARKNVDLQKETLRIITLRAQRGLVTDLDVEQATYNLGQTESIVPTLEAGYRRAENRLCILMARPPQHLGPLLHAPATIPLPPAEIVVGIPADLLRRRPDVQQAERAAAQQSAQIGIAEAEFYPHIAITGTVGVQAAQLNQLFSNQSLGAGFAGGPGFAIGPGFNWNVLNYGRIKSNVAAQDARFQQAVTTYRDTVLRADEEVENAVTSFLREQDRAASLARSAQAAERSVALATLQYEKGLIAYQPLLDSQRVLVQQEDTLAESRGLIGVDLIAVYRALGGGWRAMQASNQAPSATAPPPEGAAVPGR